MYVCLFFFGVLLLLLFSFVIKPKLFCCFGAPLSIRHWCHRYSNKPFVFRLVRLFLSFSHLFIHFVDGLSKQCNNHFENVFFAYHYHFVPLLIRINSVFIWYSDIVTSVDPFLWFSCMPTLFFLRYLLSHRNFLFFTHYLYPISSFYSHHARYFVIGPRHFTSWMNTFFIVASSNVYSSTMCSRIN